MIPERKSPYNGEMIRNILCPVLVHLHLHDHHSKCTFNYIPDPPYPVRVGPVYQLLIEGLPGQWNIQHNYD